MPTPIRAAVLVYLAVACVSCGAKQDPVAARCDEICTPAADHPCAKSSPNCGGDCAARCRADCKRIAGDAALKAAKKDDCGVCVAGKFSFAASPNNQECYGVKQPTSAKEPPCDTACIEP